MLPKPDLVQPEPISQFDLLQGIMSIHYRGWTHFKESEETLKKKFQTSGINDKTIWLKKGIPTIIE